MTADEERLARIPKLRKRLDTLTAQAEAVRAELFAEIRAAFPENRGEPPVRGRLAKVTEASGWTREYVANIRDGKVKASEAPVSRGPEIG